MLRNKCIFYVKKTFLACLSQIVSFTIISEICSRGELVPNQGIYLPLAYISTKVYISMVRTHLNAFPSQIPLSDTLEWSKLCEKQPERNVTGKQNGRPHIGWTYTKGSQTFPPIVL